MDKITEYPELDGVHKALESISCLCTALPQNQTIIWECFPNAYQTLPGLLLWPPPCTACSVTLSVENFLITFHSHKPYCLFPNRKDQSLPRYLLPLWGSCRPHGGLPPCLKMWKKATVTWQHKKYSHPSKFQRIYCTILGWKFTNEARFISSRRPNTCSALWPCPHRCRSM